MALLRVNVLQSTVYVQGMSGGGAEGNAYTCTGRQTDRQTDRQTGRQTHTHMHTHTDQHDPSLFLQPAKLSKWQGRALTLAINPKAVFVISRDPSVRLRTVDECGKNAENVACGVCVYCVCVYNIQYTVSVLHVSVSLPGASPGVPPGRFELGCGQ